MSLVKDVTILAERIGRVRGVVAVVLFGSYARREQDEGSDLDLLVLFRNSGLLRRGLRLLHKKTSRVPLFVQAIAMTVQEFQASWLFQSVLREGRLLYAEKGFSLWDLAEGRLRPYGLVAYNLEDFEPSRKVRFVQDLYGRVSEGYEYAGFIGQVGAIRVGRNIMMVPRQHLSKLTAYLEDWRVPWTQRQVWST